MQKKCIKVVFFFTFLNKYSLKNAFLMGFGEQFGEQNHSNYSYDRIYLSPLKTIDKYALF